MSGKPRVLIVNERFLPRFGVDRILLLLAERLVQSGFDVQFACLRCEREALARISDDIIELLLPEGCDFAAAEEFAADQLIESWRTSLKPDVVVTGGWPFFTLAARSSSVGVKSIFIDAGAVPHDGFPDSALPVQLELRRRRRVTLPYMGKILPISDFIRFSQTEPERGNAGAITTVHLGADHFDHAALKPSSFGDAENSLVQQLQQKASKGAALILMLGRFESSGYKNSPAVFDVFRKIQSRVKGAHLVLLAGPDAVAIPANLQNSITTLPTISDVALLSIMKQSRLGLGLSLWEGFNLPIAEMQWLGRPTLAFNIGAHPEIIADPWLLCESPSEMARKAVEILTDSGAIATRLDAGFAIFKKRFVWERTLAQWTDEIVKSQQEAPHNQRARLSRTVFMDVSNSCRDPGNSGVIRVTRRLGKELSQRGDLNVVFVVWNPALKTYSLPPSQAHTFLSSNGGPTDWLGIASSRNDDPRIVEKLARSGDPRSGLMPVLLLPEVILDGTAQERVAWARLHKCKTACIFYDMLPVYSRELVARSVQDAFPDYVVAVSKCDAAWAISGFSKSEFERYVGDQDLDKPKQREAVWLPGQFSDINRRTELSRWSDDIHILMISTLEPRKNHAILLEAFKLVRQRNPDMPVYLHLVGNSYVEAREILTAVQRATREDDHILYHGPVSDAVITKLYEQVSFTVYPSRVEGFGLPVLESLWMGCPCICGETGVMAELAEGGGCLTVDIMNAFELAAAIERIASDPELFAILRRQAYRRQIDTWSSYADKIAHRLHAV